MSPVVSSVCFTLNERLHRGRTLSGVMADVECVIVLILMGFLLSFSGCNYNCAICPKQRNVRKNNHRRFERKETLEEPDGQCV